MEGRRKMVKMVVAGMKGNKEERKKGCGGKRSDWENMRGWRRREEKKVWEEEGNVGKRRKVRSRRERTEIKDERR